MCGALPARWRWHPTVMSVVRADATRTCCDIFGGRGGRGRCVVLWPCLCSTTTSLSLIPTAVEPVLGCFHSIPSHVCLVCRSRIEGEISLVGGTVCARRSALHQAVLHRKRARARIGTARNGTRTVTMLESATLLHSSRRQDGHCMWSRKCDPLARAGRSEWQNDFVTDADSDIERRRPDFALLICAP